MTRTVDTSKTTVLSGKNGALASYLIECANDIYHYGFDTAYISYHGQSSPNFYKKLLDLKQLSKEHPDKTLSMIELDGITYSVAPYGMGRFTVVLQSHGLFLLFSKPTSALPAMQAQIKSEGFFQETPEYWLKYLDNFAHTYLGVSERSLSRLDLCMDFTTDYRFRKMTPLNFISRSRDLATFQKGGLFEGMSAGRGGQIMFRLYDKIMETKKTGKEHWLDVYRENGWSGEKRVHRAEFQLKRQALESLDLLDPAIAFTRFASTWEYLTKNWCRFVDTNDGDSVNSRWQISKFWQNISTYFDGIERPKINRTNRKVSRTNMAYKYTCGLSSILGHMAELQTSSFADAAVDFFKEAVAFHGGDDGFISYAKKKVHDKCHKLAVGKNKFSFFASSQSLENSIKEWSSLEAVPF